MKRLEEWKNVLFNEMFAEDYAEWNDLFVSVIF